MNMREEVETTLDTLETWVSDDSARDEIREAFPVARDLADVAKRLYDVSSALSDFALAIWPPMEAPR